MEKFKSYHVETHQLIKSITAIISRDATVEYNYALFQLIGTILIPIFQVTKA